MGIIPLFDWGEANVLFLWKNFLLINEARSRIKVFEPFEDSFKQSSMINAVSISYGCVFKRSSKPTMKGPKVLSFEEARKEYKLQHGGLTIKKDINSNIKD